MKDDMQTENAVLRHSYLEDFLSASRSPPITKLVLAHVTFEVLQTFALCSQLESLEVCHCASTEGSELCLWDTEIFKALTLDGESQPVLPRLQELRITSPRDILDWNACCDAIESRTSRLDQAEPLRFAHLDLHITAISPDVEERLKTISESNPQFRYRVIDAVVWNRIWLDAIALKAAQLKGTFRIVCLLLQEESRSFSGHFCVYSRT